MTTRNKLALAIMIGLCYPELDNGAASAAAAEVENPTTLLDLDDIEGMDFDSIEDPPGFVTPPDGVYDLLVTKGSIEKYKTREEPDVEKKRFAIYYEVKQVVELDDPAEQAPKAGDKFSERFMMNENGMKYWKGKAKAILGDVGNLKVSNVLAELSSGTYEFRARINNKKTAGKKGTPNEKKVFTNSNVKVIARKGEIPGLGGEAGTTGSATSGIAVE